MMKIQRCWYCGKYHEFYQRWTIVPPCPRCGAGANGDPPVIPANSDSGIKFAIYVLLEEK